MAEDDPHHEETPEIETRRGGRPRKAEDEKKSRQVTLYMTPREHETLTARATAAGVRLAPFLLEASLKGSVKQRKNLHDKRAWGEFKRVAQNVNQVAAELSSLRLLVSDTRNMTQVAQRTFEHLAERLIRQNAFIREEMSALRAEYEDS